MTVGGARVLGDGCEAIALLRGFPGAPSSHGAPLWLQFASAPTPSRWYRANKASIVAGYLTLAVPPLIDTAAPYPLKTELIRAALWLMVAGLVGYTVRQLVDEVRKLASRHRSVLETANEAFMSMDSEGLIIDWNTQAEHEFGWRRHEVIGLPLEEVIIPKRLRSPLGPCRLGSVSTNRVQADPESRLSVPP